MRGINVTQGGKMKKKVLEIGGVPLKELVSFILKLGFIGGVIAALSVFKG